MKSNGDGKEPREAGAGAAVNGLGEKLRQLRLQRGESLTRVADATGMSSSFLSLVETGRSDLTVARLVRLAAQLVARPVRLAARPAARLALAAPKPSNRS